MTPFILFAILLFISILLPIAVSIYYWKSKPKNIKTKIKDFHISINETYQLSDMPSYVVKVISINNIDEKVSVVTTTEKNKVSFSISKDSFLKNYQPTNNNLYNVTSK